MLESDPKFPIVMSHYGLNLYTSPFGRSVGIRASGTLLGGAVIEDPLATVLSWSELLEVRPVDPWPNLLIRWRTGSHVFSAAPGKAERVVLLHADDFATEVEKLLNHLGRMQPHLPKTGWTDFPIERWEQVSTMPALPADRGRVGDGAFRSAERAVEEEAIAVRTKPSSMEVLLDWLSSRPERPFKEHPGEVRLSEDALYTRRKDSLLAAPCYFRLRLSALRLRIGGPEEDAVYIFGRKTQLVLPHRQGCPVRFELDRRLAQAQPAGS